MLEGATGALLRRVSVRGGHSARRRGQPRAADSSRDARRRRARGSRSCDFRTCRTRRISGCSPGRTGSPRRRRPTTTSSSCLAARTRSRICSGSGPSVSPTGSSISIGSGATRDWHLRRVPDAGPARLTIRPGWSRDLGVRRRPGADSLDDDADAGETDAGGACHDRRRRDVRRIRDSRRRDGRRSAASAAPFATLEDGTTDGLCGDGVIGTYLHGALESADVCAEVFGIPMPALPDKAVHYRELAHWFERHGRHLDRLGFD